MKKLLTICLLCIAFLYCSCDGIITNNGRTVTGNGVVVNREFAIKDFKDIDVSSSITVVLAQADKFDVKLEGEDNIVSLFDVKLVGEKLVIKPKGKYNLSFKKPLKAYISAPVFRKLEASGACAYTGNSPIRHDGDIELDLSGSCNADLELHAPSVSADISGACRLKLSGTAKEFRIDGSGSSEARCFGLMADVVNIDFSGAGMAEVSAARQLKVDISGAANIRYKGNPGISQEVSGAASIKKAD